MLEDYNEVLDIKDICKELRIGRSKAYQILNKGEIPYRRIGRDYRVRKEAVIKYLEEDN